MIIWQGWGIVAVPLALFAGFFVGEQISEEPRVSWWLAAAFVFLFALGLRRARQHPGGLFFVPTEAWAIIFLAAPLLLDRSEPRVVSPNEPLISDFFLLVFVIVAVAIVAAGMAASWYDGHRAKKRADEETDQMLAKMRSRQEHVQRDDAD